MNKGADEEDSQKVAVVTGSSSGLGYATSNVSKKWILYMHASPRNIDKSAGLQSIAEAESLPLRYLM